MNCQACAEYEDMLMKSSPTLVRGKHRRKIPGARRKPEGVIFQKSPQILYSSGETGTEQLCARHQEVRRKMSRFPCANCASFTPGMCGILKKKPPEAKHAHVSTVEPSRPEYGNCSGSRTPENPNVVYSSSSREKREQPETRAS